MSLPRVVAAPALTALTALSSLLALLASLLLPGASIAAQSTTSGDTIHIDSGAVATVSGIVYDSLAGKSLSDALVQLTASDGRGKVWSATTGANGEFELAAVPRGTYLVGFLHPSIDSLGIAVPPRALEVSGAAALRVDLAVPSAATIRDQLCSHPDASDSSGLVLGFIRDADSDMPLDGASMVTMWTEIVVQNGIHTIRRQVPVKSSSEGWYALCGVPTDAPITARAELGNDASGYIEIRVPPGGLLHRDFRIPRGAASIAINDTADGAAGEPIRHGSARLAGTVRTGQGKPLAGAQLMLWGSGITGSTGDDGTFSLSELPAGTQALEVRYVGYAPKRVTVELASNQTRSVAVTLDERADVLGEVTVYGKPTTRNRDLTGFLARRKHGDGHFITRSDIEKMHAFQFTDLMRIVPGFTVMRGPGFESSIVSTRGGSLRGACQPRIYLNGMPYDDSTDINFLVEPNDVAGVEIYAGAASPPQFMAGPCGSIVIWTGPNLDTDKK